MIYQLYMVQVDWKIRRILCEFLLTVPHNSKIIFQLESYVASGTLKGPYLSSLLDFSTTLD